MSTYILSQFPIKRNDSFMKKISKDLLPLLAILIVASALISVMAIIYYASEDSIPELEPVPIEVEETLTEIEESEPHEVIPVKEPFYSDEELIAMVVNAESGGEPMIGKVAVASVVLNRCDYYDQTVESIVYAKDQFAISKIYTSDDLRAVEIAKENRDLFPNNMLYFRNKHYHKFGEEYMVIGSHYFSLAKNGE